VRIIEEARDVLEKYNYIVSLRGEDMLQFEDETLLGFVCELSLESLLQTWSSRQDDFLRNNARTLANSALKAWNLYSVFLSSDVSDEAARKSIITIEEDFRASRKVILAGVQTTADVVRALYPFIPIQNIAALETSDSLLKLQGRLSALPQAAVDVLLRDPSSNESISNILKRFQEAHEIKTT
jgi:hypothetical protein